MPFNNKNKSAFALIGLLALSIPANLAAQAQEHGVDENTINVYGSAPADLTGLAEGPEIEGFISAHEAGQLLVTTPEGVNTSVHLSEATQIKGKGGFLGLSSSTLGARSLLTGLPVKVETVVWGDNLVANRIRFSNSDLDTAQMIRNGTHQQFAQQGAAIESLRGRVANIDQYNIKSTTNVYFDSGKWNLSRDAEYDLCSTARQADATDNALLLVVGYTDSTGAQEYNQILSERRAGRVVNYLQQQCKWAPYRMLSPTGMSESDPLADNTTAAGRRQNRRVSVNILVSKAVDN